MVTVNTSPDTDELIKMALIGAVVMILIGGFIYPGQLLLWALVGAVFGGAYDIYVQKPKRNGAGDNKERERRAEALKNYGRR